MSAEENKKLVIGFLQALEKGDSSVLDEITVPGCAIHPDGTDKTLGIEYMKHGNTNMRIAFPDMSFTIDNIVAEGDMVTARQIWQGTHSGKFRNTEPTSKKVKSARFLIFRFEQGKIAELWFLSDALSVYQQLGVLPPAEEIGK